MKLTESPAVREFAVAALAAAAQAKADRAAATAAGNGRGLAGRKPPAIDGDRLARVVRTAELDGIRRFMEGFDEVMRSAARATGDGDEVGSSPPALPSSQPAGAPGE